MRHISPSSLETPRQIGIGTNENSKTQLDLEYTTYDLIRVSVDKNVKYAVLPLMPRDRQNKATISTPRQQQSATT
jgi:hypothetical protein